jgi:type IV secretion system protein TrbE
MKRCLNQKALLLGIPMPFTVLLLTFAAVSFLAVGSLQVSMACLIVYIIARVLYWYNPLFFLFLGSYLRKSDLHAQGNEQRRGKQMSDVLLWKGLAKDCDYGSVIQNTDGSYQVSYRVCGLDLFSMSGPEIQRALKVFDDGLKILSEDGVTIFWECRRSKCLPGGDAGYVSDHFPPDLENILAENRNACKDADLFANEYFFTAMFTPDSSEQKVSALSRFFIRSQKKAENRTVESDTERFSKILSNFNNVVSEGFELTALSQAETAAYLHGCVSAGAHNAKALVTANPSEWSTLIPDQSLHKGLNPILGDQFIKIVGVKGFPEDFSPEMRNEIARVPFEFRWCTRIDLFKDSKARNLVKGKKTTWANSSIKFKAMFASMFTGSDEDVTEKFEARMADECQDVMDDLYEGKYALSRIASAIIILDKDSDSAGKKSELIRKIYESHGLKACVEELNAMQAFLSSIPGTFHQNSRHFSFTTTGLVNHILPLNSPWKGAPNHDCLFVAKGRD